MLIRNFKSRKGIYFLAFTILFCLLTSLSTSVLYTLDKSSQMKSFETLKLSGQVTHQNIQWLDNPTFEEPIEPIWVSSIVGDVSDVNATTTTGQANFEILGNIGKFSNVSGTPSGSDWTEYNNTYFILPDDVHEINEKGCEAAHTFNENFDQSRNRPSVHWRRNITMPIDMSDYIITSVSLNAIVNGSADRNLETPNDVFPGFATYYDYARFYVKISNLDYENLYEAAYYQTVDLGEGAPAGMSYLNDTLMTVINQQNLKFYLTKALEKDPYTFGITLGIDIYCEDNYDFADLDVFYSLLIKSVNLSFTYEKKMDQLTSISWYQIADMVNGSNVQITESNLTFKYKINDLWSESISPNSEIKILINDLQHSETIKLSSATTSFQEAKIGGFDLTDITLPYENLTFSIQVIIGDEFGLNRTVIVSIDDVYLEISYTETFPDPRPISEPLIFRILLIVAGAVALCLGGYLVAYQRVLKYPRPIRKVMKYKRTLKKKNPPSTLVINRDTAFNSVYKTEMHKTSKHLKGKPTEEISKTLPKTLGKKKLSTDQNLIKNEGGSP